MMKTTNKPTALQAAMASLQAKLACPPAGQMNTPEPDRELANRIQRRSSAPELFMLRIQEAKQRLSKLRDVSCEQDSKCQESIQRLNLVRNGLQDTLSSCHKVLEVSGRCLEEYFRHIPAERLSQEISRRFEYFDKNANGTLEREEVREGLAELGQRPDDLELDTFFAICDTDSSGGIDKGEFEAMVRVKLGLESVDDIIEVARSANKRLGKLAAAKLPPVRARRGSLSVEERCRIPARRTAESKAAALPSATAAKGPTRTKSAEMAGPLQRKPSLEALHRRTASAEVAAPRRGRRSKQAWSKTKPAGSSGETGADKAVKALEQLELAVNEASLQVDAQG